MLGFEESSVFISYAVVSVTGPTTGCAFGNFLLIQVDTLSIKKEAIKTLEQSSMSSPFLLSESEPLFLFPLLTISMALASSFG